MLYVKPEMEVIKLFDEDIPYTDLIGTSNGTGTQHPIQPMGVEQFL